MVVIAGCIIVRDNKILMVKEAKKKCYGQWNFPAGHVDELEKITDAAVRTPYVALLDVNNNKIIENNSCDAIVTNPPYMKKNSGIKNENEMKLISRHEIKCNIEDIIKVSSKLLKDNGELYMVHRPDRLVGIIECLRKYKIEPKKIRFVYSKKEDNSNLVLIKAVKNAGEFLKIEKPLYIYDENNKYTDEVLEIYNKK